MNNTLNLQGERLGLFNPITGLDNKSFAKVKRMSKAYPRSPTRKDGIGQQEKKHEQSMPGIRKI
ncbi:MAG: hypothetical protein ACLR6J_14965 [Parabacteroides merdae]